MQIDLGSTSSYMESAIRRLRGGGMHGMLGHANGMSGMRQRPAER